MANIETFLGISVMKQLRKRLLFAASLLALLVAQPLAAQAPGSATIVKASRLLDPRTGNVLTPGAVLIEGNKIKEVGSASQVQPHAPAGARTIELSVLPPHTVTTIPDLLATRWTGCALVI